MSGIVFIGGLVRGFADKSSDIDIVVFIDRKDDNLRKQIYSLGAETQKRFATDLDLEIHFLDDFKKWRWNEIDRWEFSKARIFFDSEGEIKRVFEEKLKVPKDFWIKRIAICSEYLKWYCCPTKEGICTVAESWIGRGDLVSAHYCLNYAADLLIRLIFALNKEFMPAPKWRMHYSHGLEWQPQDYKELIREGMTLKNFSARDFHRRIDALRKIWRKIGPKTEKETGLTREQISKYYVEEILHQTGIPPQD